MEEIWKDAIGFEGLYQVSNFGRARSIAHEVNCNKGKRIVKGKLLKAVDSGNGYAFVTFGKDGKQYNISLHRMVASVFIPNPLNLPEVNHIDRNPMNARADNLEWCDRTYNNNYDGRAYRANAKRKRIICMYGLDGKLIQKYGSLSEAADKNGINAGNISECCRGKRKTAGGFRWEQEDQK